LHLPVGVAKFESESGGFSMSKLRADEIKTSFGPSFEGDVYDGKNGNGTIINVTFNDGGDKTVKGDAQQTYLVRYPIPLGLDDVREEMKANFNEAVDDKITDMHIPGKDAEGFMPQPPMDVELAVPVSVNTGTVSGRDTPEVTGVSQLLYYVNLTFKQGGLPKVNGTGAVISEANKDQFLNWVQFKTDNSYGPAASVLLDLDANIVTWVSPQITKADIGSSETTLLDVKFALQPASASVFQPNGIRYKPDLELHDFNEVKIKLTKARTEKIGDTGAFAEIIDMLGGAEFTVAQMFLFTKLAINNFTLKATEAGKSNSAAVSIANGENLPATNAFDRAMFYTAPSETAKTIAKGDGQTCSFWYDLTAELLKKNAPKYDIWYTIPEGSEFTLGRDSDVDAVILVPLSFTVTGHETPSDGEAALVKVEKANGQQDSYIKLNVKAMDDMLGEDADDFDLKKHTQDFGTLKSAKANLTISNPTLPDDFYIGLGYGRTASGGLPLYDSALPLKDGSKEDIELTTGEAKIRVPRPALLLPVTSGGDKAAFKIDPAAEAAGGDLSVRIIADVVVDLKYSLGEENK
ncbi:MAG: hypothetical protein LBD22_03920, partial [Spirochaetaceae bacterium]|nr:hypothetical protein [Spirochaetaceae bacterium]